MRFCYLTIVSKNKTSLKNAFKFLLKISHSNLNIVTKFFEKKKKKSVFTVLKSPHVHKKAQEQFETRLFSKHLLVFSIQSVKHIFLIKKILAILFSDVHIKIKWLGSPLKIVNLRMKILVLDNFQLNLFYNFFTQNFKLSFINETEVLSGNTIKLKNFLSIMDFYGECCFKI